MSLSPQLIFTVAIVCLGLLQFGYHMAELNSPESILSCRISKPGPVPYSDSWFGSHGFKECIPLNALEVGLITSIFSIGGLVGSFYVGNVADAIGRKKTALVHLAIFFVGSTINAFSNKYSTLLLGRFVAGVGAGAALVVTAVYINEISPSQYKGLLGLMNQVSINVGILFTQVLALKWCNNNQWRLLLLTGSAISLLTFFLVLVYLDELPVWLMSNGYSSQAFRVLHRIRGGEYVHARNEATSWEASENDQLVESEEPAPSQGAVDLSTYLKSSEYTNSKVVATGILVLQQFCGINSIVFYGVSVLISIFPNRSVIINFLISLVNVVVTFAAAQVVDRLGRKPLLLTSVTFLGILSAVMGVGILSNSAILSIVGTFTYITFFAIGLGPIPFLLVGEVTQTKAKALAQSWGTAMNWVATFIVGYSFPILKNLFLGGGTYFIFTAMCVVSFIFIQTKIPETKGTTSYEQVWGLRVD